ncbi:TetR family transcriptional regulator [Elizabethkingia anophelis]|nr:TetR family transcriptional regulator [Elizabethkingia anophelis]
MKETPEYIIEKVAPVFNKKGYTATSLSEITKATSLTKGAVYFYFKNKEDLAVKAFHFNIEKIIKPLRQKIGSKENSIEKLKAITEYFRSDYFDFAREIGGCPMLNLGVDAQFNNKVLFDEAQKISKVFIRSISDIIKSGILKKEIKAHTEADKISMVIYAMTEEAVFMAITKDDKSFLTHMNNHIDSSIIEKMRI